MVKYFQTLLEGQLYSEDFSEKHKDLRTLVQHLALNDLCGILNRCNEVLVNSHITPYTLQLFMVFLISL